MSGNEHDNMEPETLHAKLCALILGEADEGTRVEVERALAHSPELRAQREQLEATIGLVRAAMAGEELLSPHAEAALAAAAEARGRERAPRPWHRATGFRLAAAALALLGGAWAAFEGVVRRELESSEDVAELAWAERTVPADKSLLQEAVIRAQEVAAADPASGADAPAMKSLGEQAPAESPALPASTPTPFELYDDKSKDGARGSASAEAVKPVDELKALRGVEAQLEQARRDSELSVGVIISQPPAPAEARPPGLQSAEPSQGRQLDLRFSGHAAPGTATNPPTAGGGDVAGLSKSALAELRVGELAQRGPATPGSAAPTTAGAPQWGLEPALGLGQAAFGPGQPESEALKQLRSSGYLGDRGEDALEEGSVAFEGYRFTGGLKLRTQQDVEQLHRLILEDCRRRPQERPRDMFFRYWGDNAFELAQIDPLSTFSIDVDTASYALARRYLMEGRLPEKAQVRTEEFVNYFRGDVPAPTEGTFRIATELAPSLFGGRPDAWMLRVAVRGREVARQERQPLALTFVIDVSGSMKEGGRLELVKHALRLLLGELDARDALSLVAFSNEARLVLPMTSAAQRGLIESALHPLAPNGGTNAEAGLRMGYEQALAALTKGAHNRVVLLSDGVANIGQTDQDRINADVRRHRKSGVYLNTIGVGMNNHNDVFLEQLANKGDGLCNYIDTPAEARRALVENFTGAFEPIARDVKIQVEFDPAQVESYRLLGYENRAIADQDFRNDAVDAGEVGAGHQVVALYELVRTGREGDLQAALATVRLRWKPPHAQGVAGPATEEASEVAHAVVAREAAGAFAATSAGYRRSVLVAQLAEFLRRSVHARGDRLETLLSESVKLAAELKDAEFEQFVELVTRSQAIVAAELARRDHELEHCLHRLREHCWHHAQLSDLGAAAERLQELDNARAALEAELHRLLEDRMEATPRVR